MSDQWDGGKGDKSRVTDVQAYRNNWEKIFNKPIENKYNLFLDDFRNPKDAWLYDYDVSLQTATSVPTWDWVMVRNYDQFVGYIEENGIPKRVSFDNDLNDKHMNYFSKVYQSDGIYDYESQEKTGIHCALWLLEKCRLENKPFPEYTVHSANHFARRILKDLLP